MRHVRLELYGYTMSCCEQIIEAAGHVTPCECAGAGYCIRHKMHKPAHFAMLCRTHIGYFNLYEKGEGPGQKMPAPGSRRLTVGLGDVAAFLIRVVTLGKLIMCDSCKGRKAWLNRVCPLWPICWPWRKR